MIRIPVEKAHGADDPHAEAGAVTEQVRQLAFHLFESRGAVDGHDLEDWLEVERELVLTPESQLVQRAASKRRERESAAA